jgi:hypothetical protein
MNERIRQLAVQAGILLRQKDFSYFWVESAEDIEKFAQLIIEECMEQVWYSREDGINGNVSQVIKDRIKQHFGVEL